MKKIKTSFLRGIQVLFLTVILFFVFTMGLRDCKEPPPCADFPNSFSGEADGYVYREYSDSRMTSDWVELCVNFDDNLVYYTNTEDMQAIFLYDTIDDVDVIIIYYYDFKEPYTVDDGMIMMTTQSAAEYSNEHDWSIPIDGKYAIAWFFMGTWYDKDPVPTHISTHGELTFPTFTYVTGGPVSIRFHGELEEYIEQIKFSSTSMFSPSYWNKLINVLR